MLKLHNTIIKLQMRSHAHVRMFFLLGKQSPTAMGTVGSNTTVENHAVIFKGGNVGAKKYDDHRGTRLISNKEIEAR